MPETKAAAGVLIRNNHLGPKRQKAVGLLPFFDQAQRTAWRFGGNEFIDKPTIDGKLWE
jgi:hypothetical protein